MASSISKLPFKGNQYYKIYQNYFISKIKERKIETIYETRKDDKIIIGLLLDKKCFNQERAGEMLIKIKLKFDCKELK